MNYLQQELHDLIQKDIKVFEFIQTSALDGLWYWDLENPENEWMSERFWEVMGYEPEKMPHKAVAWQDKIHPEDLKVAIENFTAHCEDPKHPYDQIVRYFHKDGGTVWVRCRGMAIRDENGKPLRMLGAHNEITNLKQREELLEQTSRLANIGYWALNLSKNQVFWSDETKRIHEVEDSYTPDVKTGIQFYHGEEEQQRISAYVQAALTEGKSFDDTFSIKTSKGRIRMVRSIGIPEFVNGECKMLRGLFQDITEQKEAEENLKHQAIGYQTALEAADLGVWEWHHREAKLKLNYKALVLCRIESQTVPGEMLEVDWRNLIYSKDLGKIEALIPQLHSRKKSEINLAIRINTESDYRWTRWTGHLSMNSIGEVYYLGIIEDVHDQYEQQQLLQTFIRESPTPVVMLNREYKVLASSQAWLDLHLLGNHQDVEGQNFNYLFPRSSSQWMPYFMRTEEGETIKSNAELLLQEDGSSRWMKWGLKPWYQEGNLMGGYILYQEDVSARRAASERLKISERTFRGNFENAAIGMAILDSDGKWLQVNDKVLDITGYSRDELLKLSFQDITHPDDLNSDLALLQQLIDGSRDHYQMEKRYITKHGEVVYILLGASVIRDDNGGVLYFVSQIIDINARKLAEKKVQMLLEQEQQRSDRLNSFTHIVSHNLRSHSTSISRLIEFLKEEHPDLLKNEMFEYLIQASSNLNTTIENLKEVVEIQGATTSQMKPCNLKELQDLAIKGLQLQVQSSGIKIQSEISEDLELMGFRAYLESLFYNMISNAIRYSSSDRKPEIKIYTKRKSKNFIDIYFEDNGVGIDMDRNADRVFGMYNTFHYHPESRGLGLFLTRNQVEVMGGQITVESVVNQGTTFRVTLPYEES